MAARTRVLQLAVVVVNIVIAGLVFTSVWPFPSGDVNIHLPSAHEVSWTYSNGLIHVIAPFSIDNGWIYDIDDLTVTYSVKNGTSSQLAGQTISVGQIPAGRITSSQLDFEFDLLSQYNQGIDWMVFHEDMLYFHLEVSCWYTMRLIQFDATYQVSVPWDALIQGFGVDRDNITGDLGPPPTVSVPYWLNTSRILSGLSADITVTLFDNATQIGTAQTQVGLGGPHTGTVTVGLTAPAVPTRVVLEVQFGGFTVTKEVFL